MWVNFFQPSKTRLLFKNDYRAISKNPPAFQKKTAGFSINARGLLEKRRRKI
jgi:hypothetical protein